MPLFVCTKCNAVENTGVSDYWEEEMSAYEAGQEFRPRCSECSSGHWHGKFPKRDVSDTDYVLDGKFLKHKSEML